MVQKKKRAVDLSAAELSKAGAHAAKEAADTARTKGLAISGSVMRSGRVARFAKVEPSGRVVLGANAPRPGQTGNFKTTTRAHSRRKSA
jgi:hypothetical protein